MIRFFQSIVAFFTVDWDAFIRADSEEEDRIMHEP